MWTRLLPKVCFLETSWWKYTCTHCWWAFLLEVLASHYCSHSRADSRGLWWLLCWLADSCQLGMCMVFSARLPGFTCFSWISVWNQDPKPSYAQLSCSNQQCRRSSMTINAFLATSSLVYLSLSSSTMKYEPSGWVINKTASGWFISPKVLVGHCAPSVSSEWLFCCCHGLPLGNRNNSGKWKGWVSWGTYSPHGLLLLFPLCSFQLNVNPLLLGDTKTF